MWPNQRSPWSQPDEYQAMQQMQRGQQLQQMAMHQPGTGWAGVAMALLGGFGGRRLENQGYDRLRQLQDDKMEQERAKREVLVAALTGGDTKKAAEAAFGLGQDDIGLKLLTEANKPQHVPDALWGKYTPESIGEFMKTRDPGVLQSKEDGAPEGIPQGMMWDAQKQMAINIPGTEGWHANKARRGGAPSVVVNLPGGERAVPLTKPSQNNVQEELISLNNQAAELKNLAESFSDEYLTMFGKGMNKYREYADWSGVLPLSEKGKSKLREQTEFRNRTDRMYLDFRRWATGSAASNQEDERIRNSIFNLDQSPEQFKASVSAFADDIQQKIALHQSLLQAGIPLQEVQAIFRDTPLLQPIDVDLLPSSDAQVVGGELSQQVNDVRASAPNVQPAKPSLDEFLKAAREDNPGVPEADLIAYYHQTYR